MGQLIDGVWHAGWYEPDKKGAFQRPNAVFRNRVTADGSSGFEAEPGRYHLYVSYACPWAHRTIITRAMRGLEDVISMSVVDPKMGDDGWEFNELYADALFGTRYLRDIYLRTNPKYTGRVTVPVLWDKKTNAIVCNESREVMRMLDTEFEAFAKNPTSLAPRALLQRIDETLDAIYKPINNGVYRTGFSTTQEAYEEACTELFNALDHWEGALERHRFLCGETLTEADVAMFTTLLRFDLVYHAHFKCNLKRIRDYPNLWGFLRDVYQIPAIRQTCNLEHIKVHYYWSQTTVNPHRIVPLGPRGYDVDLASTHDRAHLAKSARDGGVGVARTAQPAAR